MLEDRADTLKEQTRTFQKTARSIRVVQKRKHNRLRGFSCIICLVLLVVATAPFVIMYWDEIVAFLDSMVPPCDRFYKEERDAECEGGSGEPWGGANATEQDAGELLLEAVNASASGGDAEGGATLGETNMQHDD